MWDTTLDELADDVRALYPLAFAAGLAYLFVVFVSVRLAVVPILLVLVGPGSQDGCHDRSPALDRIGLGHIGQARFLIDGRFQ
jgi:hypothetical protein